MIATGTLALAAGTTLALGAALVVLGPLWSDDADVALAPVPPDPPRLALGPAAAAVEGVSAVEALREIEFDRATGKLSDEDYAELKASYTREALAELRAADAGVAITPPVGLDPVEGRARRLPRPPRSAPRRPRARAARGAGELLRLRSAPRVGRGVLLQLRALSRGGVSGVPRTVYARGAALLRGVRDGVGAGGSGERCGWGDRCRSRLRRAGADLDVMLPHSHRSRDVSAR